MSDFSPIMDSYRCKHGLTLNDDCERCEFEVLRDEIVSMRRKLIRKEKRFQLLSDKFNPFKEESK